MLGLVTTKRPELVSKDDLKRRIEDAAQFVGLDQLSRGGRGGARPPRPRPRPGRRDRRRPGRRGPALGRRADLRAPSRPTAGARRAFDGRDDRRPLRPLDVSTLSRDPRVGEVYNADELVWHGPFKRRTLQALEAGLATINAGPKLGALPTLWLQGENVQLVPLAESRRGVETLGFTNLESEIYPEASHEVFNEVNQDEVLGRTADFIGEVTARR